MKRLWYIKIRGRQQGPYSIAQLKCHKELTPDTLVWHPDVGDWVQIRNIPELAAVFHDNDDNSRKPSDKKKPTFHDPRDMLTHELVMEMQQEPPPVFLWLFAALSVAFLLLWKLYNS